MSSACHPASDGRLLLTSSPTPRPRGTLIKATVAKPIFTKHADSLETMDPIRLDLESKLSETYQTLGEVSIENENYPQAIEDLTMCLRRRQDLLPEDSRCIAETHYQLGVALGFNAQFDEAVNALSDAIGVLEKRISLLKESKESQGKKLEYFGLINS